MLIIIQGSGGSVAVCDNEDSASKSIEEISSNGEYCKALNVKMNEPFISNS